MLISSYLRTPARLKRLSSTENDMNLPEYIDEEIVMVRADGTAGLRYGDNKIINSTDYVYICESDIPLGSLLNDFPVKAVEPILELNGTISHYEVVAGPAR